MGEREELRKAGTKDKPFSESLSYLPRCSEQWDFWKLLEHYRQLGGLARASWNTLLIESQGGCREQEEGKDGALISVMPTVGTGTGAQIGGAVTVDPHIPRRNQVPQAVLAITIIRLAHLTLVLGTPIF